jgi:hypothetical protein
MVRQDFLDRGAHAEPRSKDRHNQVLGVNSYGRCSLDDRRVDRSVRDGSLSKGLVRDKPGNLAGETQEIGIRRRNVAQTANLVGDNGMVNDLE